MTSKVQFTQPRTAYDEEQAYQRHLAYLRTQSKNSQGFQDSLRNIKMGNMPTADAPQTADEILGDTNEINRRVQSILGKLFTDSREQYNPLGVETLGEFDKRARTSTYLMNVLPNELKVLLVTEAPSILAELKNKKLLTADTFINYLAHYNESYVESGGTSKYNTNNKLLGDITALINTLPQRATIDGLTNLIAKLGAQSVMGRILSQGQSAEMRGVVNDISNKLTILRQGLPTNEDLRQVGEAVSMGTMDILGQMDANARLSGLNQHLIAENMVDIALAQRQAQKGMQKSLSQQARDNARNLAKNQNDSLNKLSTYAHDADSNRQRDMQYLDDTAMAQQQVMDRLETLMQNIPTEAILTERLSQLGGVLRTLIHLSDQTIIKSDISQATVAIAQIKSTLLNLQDDLGAVTKIKMEEIEKLLGEIREDTLISAQNSEVVLTVQQRDALRAMEVAERALMREELGFKKGDGQTLSVKQQKQAVTRARAKFNSSSAAMAEAVPTSTMQQGIEYLKNATKKYSPISVDTEPSEKDPSSGFGFNRKNMNPRYARVMGKGIMLESEPKKFYEFGKYMVSIPHLGNNILKVKYLLNGNDVPSFKASKISDDMADFIEDLVESGKMNERTLNKLDPAEKRLFSKLIKQSGLYEKYKIRALKNPDEKAEEDRFELVKGEFIAGNDNPAIVKELKHLIIKFMTEDRIPKREGHELLFQLSI